MDTQPTLSQALNDLLAALPQMFPGTQEIPLENIRPNPDNPGPPITEQEIQELAENLKEKGLLNAIRVQPDRANPLAGGAQPHPQKPRLKANGRPWELTDFNFIVLTGQNRYLSADRLQWLTIKGTIHYMTALDANETNRLDNAIRTSRGWWADYQSIELEIKAGPNLTQRQVATRLKLSQESVGWAIGLLPLLNAEARGLIARIPSNSNKGKEGISESAASWLADLGPGTGLKRGVKAAGAETQKLWPYPPIPPETQDLVRRALVVAIDHGMSEAQVKRLVEAVKGGQKPEDYDPKAVNHQDAKTPSTAKTEIPLNPPLSKGEVISNVSSPTLAKGGQGGFSPSPQPALDGTPATPQDPHSRFKLLGHALGSAFHWVGHNSLPLLESLAGWGKREAVKSVDKSIKHYFKRLESMVVETALLFIIMAVGLHFFFPGSLPRLIAWFLNVQPPRMQTVLNHPPAGDSFGPRFFSGGQDTKGAKEGKADGFETTTALDPAITAQNTSGVGTQTLNPTTSRNLKTAPSATSKKPVTRVEKNALAALDFARHYYGADYMDMMRWIDFFKKALAKEVSISFLDRHFPPDWFQRVDHQQWIMSFQPTRPVKLLETDEFSDWFLVEGVMTTRTDIHGKPEVVSQKPVAARIVFNRESDGDDKVGDLRELTPDEARALWDSSPQADASAGPSKAESSGSTQMANPPSESAQPNQGSRQGASTQVDPVAKFIGDTEGEAAKKALNLPF